jgi:PAS domain S-box-containing protein
MAAPREAQPERSRPLASIPPDTDVRGIDLALDVMEVGIFEWDAESRTYSFSDRCKKIWGFALEEITTAEMLLKRIHPDDFHLTATVLESFGPDGSGRYSIEHRIVLPDGSIRWVQVSGRTVFAGSGSMRHAARGYGSMRDVTNHKEAEQQLYERTSQLRTFVEVAPVPIAILDRSMRYIMVSDRYAEDRRVGAADLIGRTPYEVFPDIPQRWREVYQNALRGETERGDHDQFVQRDGSREWVRFELRPWYSADNEVGGNLLFAELITRRLEEQRALRESQARLELAIQAGTLGVYDQDFITGTITWDARVRGLWGFGPDEPVTRDMFLGGVHPDDRERVVAAIREALTFPGGSNLAMEYRVVNREDNSIHWVSSTGRVFFDGERATRGVGIIQDITDRKRTELALQQSEEELRRADERKNVYLATLSHELRNPLAPIRTAAHLLASPKLTAEQLKWVAQVIRRQTAQMASLLEDLLEVTRISRGKLVLRKEQVSVSSVVRSAIESAKPFIDEKQHHLLVTLPDEPLLVYADPLRLSQVLCNLLTNAAKYTDPEGRIELAAGLEGESLVIRVRDSGIGIPPEAIDRIFTMFWQVDRGSTDSRAGLGIGLAFVRGIMHLHGGTIEAHSDGTGRGSEFIVRLPALQSSTGLQTPTPDADDAGTGADRLPVALNAGNQRTSSARGGSHDRIRRG